MSNFTPEEITAMAREARLLPDNSHPTPETRAMRQRSEAVQHFAALVAEKAAAQERERFALECIDLVAFHGGSVEIEAAIRARSQQ